MLRDVLMEARLELLIESVQVEDEETGKGVCFPGSPTIRNQRHRRGAGLGALRRLRASLPRLPHGIKPAPATRVRPEVA